MSAAPRVCAAVALIGAPALLTLAAAVAAAAGPTIAAAPPAAATATAAPVDDAEPPLRLSLPTEEDRDAWRRPGLRIELGGRYGLSRGLAAAPGGDGYGVLVRVGARLDRRWSLLAAFHYAGVSGVLGRDLLGLRYLIAAEPVLHVGRGVSFAFGVGLGGFVEGGTGRTEPDGPRRDALVAPYTVPAGASPLPQCNGAGPAGLLRASYRWVVGPLAALGADAQVDGQYVACVDDTGRVEPDSATAIVRRQWWAHVGGSVHLVVAWR